MIAIERSRWLPHSQRTPSFRSVRHEAAGASAARSGCSARNEPGMSATSAAATKNEVASTKNGTENAARSSSEPIGGPMNVLATDSMLHIRPFARSRCSGATIDGMNVCPQLSRSTSAEPNSNVASSSNRYSPVRVPTMLRTSSGAGSVPCSASTAKAMSSVKPKRSTSISTIARLRSTLSVITPAGRVNNNHGNR